MSMPARARVAGLDRPEELVGLQDELAAQSMLVVHDERADAGLAELDGRRQSGGAAADDQALDVFGLDRSHLPAVLDGRQHRLAVERFDAHPGPDRHHARLDRQAVGDDACTARTGRWRRRCPAARRPCGGGRRCARRWRRARTQSSRPRVPAAAVRPRGNRTPGGRPRRGSDVRESGGPSRMCSCGARGARWRLHGGESGSKGLWRRKWRGSADCAAGSPRAKKDITAERTRPTGQGPVAAA